jgi:hypothetical protein
MSLSWLKVPNGINIEARRWEIRVTTSQKCCHRSRSVPGEVAIVPHELWLESYHFAEEMSSQIRGTNFFVNQKPSRLQDIRPANPGDDSFERWAVGSALQVFSNLLNWEALQTSFSLRGRSGCNWASPLHMGTLAQEQVLTVSQILLLHSCYLSQEDRRKTRDFLWFPLSCYNKSL